MFKKLLVLGLITTVAAPAFAIIHRPGGAIDTTSPEQIFIKVKNGQAYTLARGTLVTPDYTLDDGVTVAITSNTASQEVLCVTSESIAAGKYGKCQVYGYISGVAFYPGTNVSAGGRLAAGIGSGFADGNSSGYSIGVALDAASASGTVEAYLHLM